MRIGIDFDNTIVCYDGVFHELALSQGLIPSDLPASKGHVRDYLRAQGQEEAWIALQGAAYGPGMDIATHFSGVDQFFCNNLSSGFLSLESIGICDEILPTFSEIHSQRTMGEEKSVKDRAKPIDSEGDKPRTQVNKALTLLIISHKTRFPFRGLPHDLHEAARGWLKRHPAFSSTQAFFELTLEKKLARIKEERCDVFIDDLPEVLLADQFPSRVRKVLFDPNHLFSPHSEYQKVSSWDEISSLLREMHV